MLRVRFALSNLYSVITTPVLAHLLYNFEVHKTSELFVSQIKHPKVTSSKHFTPVARILSRESRITIT